MIVLVAEGGFLSELTGLLSALAGLIVAIGGLIAMIVKWRGTGPKPIPPVGGDPDPEIDSSGSKLSNGNWEKDILSVQQKVLQEVNSPEQDRWRIVTRDGTKFPVYVKLWGRGKGCRAIVPVGDPAYFDMTEVSEKLNQGL